MDRVVAVAVVSVGSYWRPEAGTEAKPWRFWAAAVNSGKATASSAAFAAAFAAKDRRCSKEECSWLPARLKFLPNSTLDCQFRCYRTTVCPRQWLGTPAQRQALPSPCKTDQSDSNPEDTLDYFLQHQGTDQILT